jgi:hypothetical protein
LFLILVAPLMFLNVACLNTQEPEERERWGDRQWRQAVRANAERLKPEEQRREGGIFSGVGKAWSGFTGGIGDLIDFVKGDRAINYAKQLLDPTNADNRREAIVYLAGQEYGRRDPYNNFFEEMTRTDNDYLVRAMAVRALNRARDEDAVPTLVLALDDPHPLVRLEAAKALANIPDDRAVAPLIKRLDNPDESVDVRIAAADALRNFRSPLAAQALVRVLRDRDFAVAWQSRNSLKLMTGRDYRYDQAAWLTYLSEGDPFG